MMNRVALRTSLSLVAALALTSGCGTAGNAGWTDVLEASSDSTRPDTRIDVASDQPTDVPIAHDVAMDTVAIDGAADAAPDVHDADATSGSDASDCFVGD